MPNLAFDRRRCFERSKIKRQDRRRRIGWMDLKWNWFRLVRNQPKRQCWLDADAGSRGQAYPVREHIDQQMKLGKVCRLGDDRAGTILSLVENQEPG
jgi:hypothetical protein